MYMCFYRVLTVRFYFYTIPYFIATIIICTNWPLFLRLLLDELQNKTIMPCQSKEISRRSSFKGEAIMIKMKKLYHLRLACFKSSANMTAAILASSSAILLAYTIASFAVSLYMHASLLLIVSSRF